MDILGQYLSAIQNISESHKEHTHRSALENLFKAILENLTQSHKDLMRFTLSTSQITIKAKIKQVRLIFLFNKMD